MNEPTSSPQPTHRKQLNTKQTELLLALYKFRFGTAELISQYQEQSVRYTNVRLKILLEQEYIGRNYDSSYRIHGRPASYYLLPKAIRLLKSNEATVTKGLHLHYYSRTAKPALIRRSLQLFRIYLKLDSIFGQQLDMFLASELAGEVSLPRPLPDALLTFSGRYKQVPECVVELCESSLPLDRLKQKLNRYSSHFEASTSVNDYPRLLLICDTVSLEREVQRYMNRTLSYRGLDLPCFTMTVRSVMNAQKPTDLILTNVEVPDESLVLVVLS